MHHTNFDWQSLMQQNANGEHILMIAVKLDKINPFLTIFNHDKFVPECLDLTNQDRENLFQYAARMNAIEFVIAMLESKHFKPEWLTRSDAHGRTPIMATSSNYIRQLIVRYQAGLPIIADDNQQEVAPEENQVLVNVTKSLKHYASGTSRLFHPGYHHAPFVEQLLKAEGSLTIDVILACIKGYETNYPLNPKGGLARIRDKLLNLRQVRQAEQSAGHHEQLSRNDADDVLILTPKNGRA